MTGRYVLLITSSLYAIAAAIVFHGVAVSDSEGAQFFGACGAVGLSIIFLGLLKNALTSEAEDHGSDER